MHILMHNWFLSTHLIISFYWYTSGRCSGDRSRSASIFMNVLYVVHVVCIVCMCVRSDLSRERKTRWVFWLFAACQSSPPNRNNNKYVCMYVCMYVCNVMTKVSTTVCTVCTVKSEYKPGILECLYQAGSSQIHTHWTASTPSAALLQSLAVPTWTARRLKSHVWQPKRTCA